MVAVEASNSRFSCNPRGDVLSSFHHLASTLADKKTLIAIVSLMAGAVPCLKAQLAL